MKTETYNLLKYEADEGKVFDWKDTPADGNHLYAKVLYLADSDSIDNYIEVVRG